MTHATRPVLKPYPPVDLRPSLHTYRSKSSPRGFPNTCTHVKKASVQPAIATEMTMQEGEVHLLFSTGYPIKVPYFSTHISGLHEKKDPPPGIGNIHKNFTRSDHPPVQTPPATHLGLKR